MGILVACARAVGAACGLHCAMLTALPPNSQDGGGGAAAAAQPGEGEEEEAEEMRPEEVVEAFACARVRYGAVVLFFGISPFLKAFSHALVSDAA